MIMYVTKIILAVLLGLLTLAACQDYELFPPRHPTPAPDSGVVATDSVLGDILRTSSKRFVSLPGYDFAPHYIDVGVTGPLRMHYLDEGPANGPVVLLLHGNPAWSYLVRDMVAPLTEAGYRVIAPDLIGFGKSDKPAERAAHTYDRHVTWVTNLIETLNLTDVTLHVQDWGGLIGLRVAAYHADRFARVALSNTALPDGTVGNETAFSRWRDTISQTVENFSTVLQRTTPTELTAAEEAAYDAPYPSNRYTAGPRELPQRVPFDPADPEASENQDVLEIWAKWTKPLITIFTAELPERPDASATAQGKAQFESRVPGAQGQAHAIIPRDQAGHYLQEDVPELLAEYLIDFMRSNP